MSIGVNAVARVLGVQTEFKDLRAGRLLYLPQRVALIGHGNSDATYTSDKFTITSASEAGQRFGFGSPIYLASAQLFPRGGGGVGTVPVTVYPLQEPDGAAPATATIDVTGTADRAGSLTVEVGGVASAPVIVQRDDDAVTVAGAIEEAINGRLSMPVSADASTDTVTLTFKTAGEWGNEASIYLDGDDLGLDFSLSNFEDGAGVPELDDALNKFGEVWETVVINATSDATEGAQLDALDQFNEGRWDSEVNRPFTAYHGYNAPDLTDVTDITQARTLDRTNVVVPVPGSRSLAPIIAAAAAANVARRSNDNPAYDFARMTMPGVVPGPDADQWSYNERNQAVTNGASTTRVRDGVVQLSDTVTPYNPEGEPDPAYRYVVDIGKLTNLQFNIDLRFASDEWDGAPLIPKGQAAVNPAAKTPSDAVADLYGIIDNAAGEALISDPDFAKENTRAEIDSQNPKRLNARTTVKLSGNANVIAVDLNFGFFFGG